MLRTYICISQHHAPWLLALAVVVCICAAATTIRLYLHGVSVGGRRGLMWLIAGGASGGAGIWATHFISMLAYEPGLPTGYEATGTLASLVIAVAGVTAGLIVSARSKRLWAAPVGGAIVGLAIAVMHYTGMAAFRTEGRLQWDPLYVCVAVTLGVAFATLSFLAACRRPTTGGAVIGALLLAVAIVSLHFVSMAAVTITPDPNLPPPPSLVPNSTMGVIVGVVSGLIMIAAGATMLLGIWTQRARLAKYRSVIDAMPNGLAYFDSEDRFVVWNAQYAAVAAEFGLRPARGRTYVDCVVRRDDEATLIADRLARRSQAHCAREALAPSGRWFRIEENRTADDRRVKVVFDISELKATVHELGVARDAAEAANRAKSVFLTNMSHEIRTPLNAVLGVADALALSSLGPEQAELVEVVRGSGRMLDRLLSDILDLARVEAGVIELRPQPFNLAGAFADVARLHAAAAREKGIGLVVESAPEADRLVFADEVRLKQILGNLVDNAVKFTDRGAVTLQALCIDSTLGRFSFVVRDTGCGFDNAGAEQLFERFRQGDGSLTRRAGGSGLGLAIARSLAELMDGALGGCGAKGLGAAFTLTLTLPGADVAEEVPKTPELPVGRPMNLLVVDDNQNNRRVLELLLRHFGARTSMVEDGQESIVAWRAGAFDAILMDMQMPVMDGLTATRLIREAERREGRDRTPIILVTANALPEHVEAGIVAGADGHLAKPITADRLFAALAGLQQGQSREEGANSVDGGAEEHSELAVASVAV